MATQPASCKFTTIILTADFSLLCDDIQQIVTILDMNKNRIKSSHEERILIFPLHGKTSIEI